MSKTLAIGIPAYNGAEELKGTLASIEAITEFQKGDLEVLIADNQSEDHTYEIAENFQRLYPNCVKITRNSSNVLFRRNLAVLCTNADSKFIWFLGVGEQVTATSLKPLFDYLQSPRGSSSKMGVLSTSNGVSSPSESTWTILHSEAYANSCFSEAISLIVVERTFAAQVLTDGEPDSRLERVFWPHLEMAIKASSSPTFQVTSPGLVSIAQNDNGWWYHSKYTIPVYVKQLEILSSSPALCAETWWASSLLEQRRGWHFAALVFESSINGIGVQVPEVFRAFRAGVRLMPAIVGTLIALSPKWFLKIAQSLKNLLL